MKKKIIILTGSEIRHTYFKQYLSNDKRFKVLKTYCEGTEKSLKNITFKSTKSSLLQKNHVLAREKSEKDFFLDYIKYTKDYSNSLIIPKGYINSSEVVMEINRLKPNLLICYGSSLIKSSLLKTFKGKFINVHLGLSPYYRGSGTNIFPIINKDYDMLGATFMYIDEGIDTGKIIHQFRTKIFFGDSPHTIGNRIIKTMTLIFTNLITNFEKLNKIASTDVPPDTHFV